jgi:hypothetical protein
MTSDRFRTGAPALAALQGVYFVVTGVWPLVHMDSFLAVTGPKTDLWLVQTVGALIAAVGAVLLLAAARRAVSWEVVLLGAGAAAALGLVDVIFVARGVIPPVYLADAAAEAALVVWWGAVAARGTAARGAVVLPT